MRGVPKEPVFCIGCDRVNGCAADRLCHACRIRSRLPANKKFNWTAELDGRLRQSYQRARTRAELTVNLDLIQRLSGFSRVVILNRAATLGLAFCQRRPWTVDEIDMLREQAGSITPGAIAEKLNRTHASVRAKLKQLEISARISEGYTQDDLRYLLGVSPKSIKKWMAWGWLRDVAGRIPEASVVRFLRQHSDQYHLSRVEEAWFKGLIFPAFNHITQPRTTTQESDVNSTYHKEACIPAHQAPGHNSLSEPESATS
jgi:hypothetical protein